MDISEKVSIRAAELKALLKRKRNEKLRSELLQQKIANIRLTEEILSLRQRNDDLDRQLEELKQTVDKRTYAIVASIKL